MLTNFHDDRIKGRSMRPVKVQWDELNVRILHPSSNQLLREHLRQKRGGYRIQEEDHPKKVPLRTAQLLRRADHAGTQVGKFCQLLHDRQGETSIRRILGLLRASEKCVWDSELQP